VTEASARTGGVDLAAESTRTALAEVEWAPGRAVLTHLEVGVSDSRIVAAGRRVGKIGIDCAFGWPDAFVDFVARHARGESDDMPGDIAWRRTLAYRETDRFVHRMTKRWPLSVSTDRLGLTAMRCAGLLASLRADGRLIDRSGGTGLVAEVYPGATLRVWGWHAAGYRTDPEVRESIIERMLREAPGLDLSAHADRMVGSSDAFDAVVAAFGARAAQLGRYEPPPTADRERAEQEGWIVLPTCSLSDLIAAGEG